MKKSCTYYKIFFVVAVLFFANNSLAQTSFVPQGSRPGTDSGIVSYASGDTFEVGVVTGQSIYCRARGSTPATDVNFSDNVTCAFGGCSGNTGRLVGNINEGADYFPINDDALSFTAIGTGSFAVTLNTVSPSPSNLIIECFNTTLFGNFNTVAAANPFNFLELSNDTNADAAALVILTNNAGTEVGRFNVTIPALQQRDVSIHDIAGASNTFGRILVSHNSIPFGVRANLSKYRLDGGSLVITASTPLATKPNAL